MRIDGDTRAIQPGRQATITGLIPGTAYSFAVLARDRMGNLSQSLRADFRTDRSFTDTIGHLFRHDIIWISGMGITRG